MTGRSPLRITVLVFLGSLLLQTSWCLAIPAFAGSDEFDHAYRAEAVAHGQWVAPPSDATRGTGAMVAVPRDIVDAATRLCEGLTYTTAVDCRPQEQRADGLVTVASGAGRYNPVFYALIGTPAQLADGSAALFTMRAASAVLCSLFLALAAYALTLWARTGWPLVGLTLAMTPVAVYSTAIAAPNGVEMTAAAALWCCMAGIARPGLPSTARRALIVAAVPAAITVVTVRSLGPLWTVLIIAAAALVHGWRPLWSTLRESRVALTAAALPVVAAGLASLWWIQSQGSLVIGKETAELTDPVRNTVADIPLWLFQAVAAFPNRNDQAPGFVYASVLIVLAALLGFGFHAAGKAMRIDIVLVGLTAVAVPTAIGIATYEDYGAAWQGRYGLPFAMGLILLPAFALELKGFRHRLQKPVLLTVAVAMTLAHLISVVSSFDRLQDRDAGLTWIFPHTWLMVVFVLAGCGLWVLALRESWPRADERTDHEAAPTPRVRAESVV